MSSADSIATPGPEHKGAGRAKGYFFGIVTSVTFGLIPLFTLPLMGRGLNFHSILFYRFLFATVALGLMLLVHRQSFRISLRDLPVVGLLGLFYTGSAMFLFWGYDYMGAGVATAIHFTYPVFVTLLMFLLFREKSSWVTWTAILLAVGGVAVLSVRGTELSFDVRGLVIVLVSALAYASYILTVNKSRVRDMNGRKLAFYVFIVSTFLFGIQALATGGIQPIPDGMSAVNLVLLAVVPTVISNITLVQAVRYIGGTLTSVLGAMEPVTAVAVGVLIFGESFTLQDAAGIVCIIAAVTMIILSQSIRRTFSSVFRMIRPRHA